MMANKGRIRPKKQGKLPYVSIIVLNYNGRAHLKECFESLRRIKYPKDRYEVIMVDNASSDDSVTYTKKNFPWVRILRLDRNYGFAEGNNRGAEIAKGEHIVFLNNDTVVHRDWLIELVKAAIENPKRICSPLMLDYYRKNRVLAGNIKMTIFGTHVCAGRGTLYSPEKFTQVDTFFPDGGSMLLKKETFEKLSKFESSYFMYGEDVAIGWKAWLLGYELVFVPSSIYWHKVGASSGGGNKGIYVYYCLKNSMTNVLKYPELQNSVVMLFWFLVVRSLWTLLEAVRNKRLSSVVEVLRAIYDFVKESPKILRERKAIQLRRVVSDKQLREKGIYLGFSDSVRGVISHAKVLFSDYW